MSGCCASMAAAAALCKCELAEYEKHLMLDNQLGDCGFEPSSGDPMAREHFLLGLKCLHSFMYDVALEQFGKARKRDELFAAARWGEAMSYRMPLWNGENLVAAQRALDGITEEAESRCSDLELGLIKCARVLFAKEKEQCERDENYLAAMRELYTRFPNDLDVACFFSLALIVVASRKAGDVGAGLLSEAERALAVPFDQVAGAQRHGGLLHLLCHAYDHPDTTIAQKGLQAARLYPSVGRAASHALHMPSHIYLRLGMWRECAASNEGSIIASDTLAGMRSRGGEFDFGNLYHSIEYLQNDLCELGRFGESRTTLQRMHAAAFDRAHRTDAEILRAQRSAAQAEKRSCPSKRQQEIEEEIAPHVPAASCHNRDKDAPPVPQYSMFEHYVIRMEARAVLAVGNWAAGTIRRVQAPTVAFDQADFYLTEAGALFTNALARLLDGVTSADIPRVAFSVEEWQNSTSKAKEKSNSLTCRDGETQQRPGLVAARLYACICARLEQLAHGCSSKNADYSAAAIRTLVEQLQGMAAFVAGSPRTDWQARMKGACEMQTGMLAFYEPSSPTLLYSNSHELYAQMLIVDCVDALSHLALEKAESENVLREVAAQARRAEQLAECCLQALPNRSSSMLCKARALRVQSHAAHLLSGDEHLSFNSLKERTKQAYAVLAEQWSEAEQNAPSVQEVVAKANATSPKDFELSLPCPAFGSSGSRCILANAFHSPKAFN